MSDKQSSRLDGDLDIENKDVSQFVRTTTCTNDNATLNSSISCSLTQGSSDKRRNEDISDSTAIEDTKRRKHSNGTELSPRHEQNWRRVANKKVRPKYPMDPNITP